MYKGWPGMDKELKALNIKSICISTPGSGFSTMHHDRKIGNWPETDVDPVLKKEAIGQFALEGSSLGAPHALAVMNHFGPERVTVLGINVPYLPKPVSDELKLPIGQQNPSDGNGDKWWTPFYFVLIKALVGKPSKTVFTPASGFMMGLTKIFAPDNAVQLEGISRAVRANPEIAAALGAELDRGVANSTRSSYIDTHAKILLEWGFDPRDIRLPGKVVVQYGEDDSDCPPSHGEFYTHFFKERCEKEGKIFRGMTIRGTGHIGGLLNLPAWIKAVVDNL
jgi:pimeloyl-ACP methyl ester carboxylesterase